MPKAQPDHYYNFGTAIQGPGFFYFYCQRCGILRSLGAPPTLGWSTDGGKTWTKKHTACPRRKTYPMPEEKRLGPNEESKQQTEDNIKKTFEELSKMTLFPKDERWTVELVDESDPEGPVIFKDAETAQPRMLMDQQTFREFHIPRIVETLEYQFFASDDPELTCIICHQGKCDLASMAYHTTKGGSHARVVVGKHSDCKRKPVAIR